jgi:hypothetical protein
MESAHAAWRHGTAIASVAAQRHHHITLVQKISINQRGRIVRDVDTALPHHANGKGIQPMRLDAATANIPGT